jgi:hypothetical protein
MYSYLNHIVHSQYMHRSLEHGLAKGVAAPASNTVLGQVPIQL